MGFSIMFHHFHDDTEHIKSQGSIDSNTFENLILYLKKNYNLLNADEWIQKSLNNSLQKKDICLSFDDALKCQLDIALPILDKYNLKVIWSIYTSILNDTIELLEVFRYFRHKYYDNIDCFYNDFFEILRNEEIIDFVQANTDFDKSNHLIEYVFYSDSDRKFRYFRDKILSNDQYKNIYFKMMDIKNFDYTNCISILWMNKKQIKLLSENNHLIALHSHSHPTNLSDYNYEDQLIEYSKNKNYLESIINKPIYIAAYPCGSYNKFTSSVMDTLNIKIGFLSRMDYSKNNNLFLPREDHTNILNSINLKFKEKKNENNYIHK